MAPTGPEIPEGVRNLRATGADCFGPLPRIGAYIYMGLPHKKTSVARNATVQTKSALANNGCTFPSVARDVPEEKKGECTNNLMKSKRCKIEKPKSFRISAKRILLTYSQVNQQLTKQDLLNHILTKHKVERYIVAEEQHQDGGKHFHVLLESKTKFNIRHAQDLDIPYKDIFYHGNYQVARQYKTVGKYIAKNNNYITNYSNFHDGEFVSMEEDILHIVTDKGMEKAKHHYLNNYAEHALRGLSIHNATRYLNSVHEILSEDKSNASKEKNFPLKLKDFTIPVDLQTWMAQGFQPTLLLFGEGGTGKTAFCKALAHELGWNLFFCNHLEGLKRLRPEHNALLFDDLTLKNVDEQQLLALLGTEETRDIRVLKGVIEKPKGLIQMMTINTNVLKTLKKKLQHKQFLRRIFIVKLKESILRPDIMNDTSEVTN